MIFSIKIKDPRYHNMREQINQQQYNKFQISKAEESNSKLQTQIEDSNQLSKDYTSKYAYNGQPNDEIEC